MYHDKTSQNDRSNKSSIYAKKLCRLRLAALALGLYNVQNHEKELCKIRVQSIFKCLAKFYEDRINTVPSGVYTGFSNN